MCAVIAVWQPQRYYKQFLLLQASVNHLGGEGGSRNMAGRGGGSAQRTRQCLSTATDQESMSQLYKEQSNVLYHWVCYHFFNSAVDWHQSVVWLRRTTHRTALNEGKEQGESEHLDSLSNEKASLSEDYTKVPSADLAHLGLRRLI